MLWLNVMFVFPRALQADAFSLVENSAHQLFFVLLLLELKVFNTLRKFTFEEGVSLKHDHGYTDEVHKQKSIMVC